MIDTDYSRKSHVTLQVSLYSRAMEPVHLIEASNFIIIAKIRDRPLLGAAGDSKIFSGAGDAARGSITVFSLI